MLRFPDCHEQDETLSQPAHRLKVRAALRDGPSTRRRILMAALKAFARHGFDGVSLRTIAVEAGVNHQLIAHHFGSKQDLWDAALEARQEDFQEFHQALSITGDSSDPRDQFRSCVKTIIKFTLASPDIPCIHYHEALINRSARKNSDRYQRLLEDRIARYRTQIQRLLTQAMEAGIIAQVPIDDFFFVFQGAVLHRIIVAKESEHFAGVPIEEVVDAHTDAIVGSFAR
ncbi:MAG: TetR/AcrR family transcriptional regulator [Proteobacteria bacterium]|nr:TetR/AcrR family transcriptional regulator [Pseudomonadota bacterium]MYJ97143.1 TetR/AcrR family transcriptional regulator [Pseudomonadota bacterium]